MPFLRDTWKSLRRHRDPSPVRDAAENHKELRKELHRNEDFQLVHVGEEEDGTFSMKLVILDDHYSVRRDVHSEGFFALSHFWGDMNLCEPWTDHGILDDNGDPIAVMIRPEKCETVLALLRSHPGYWWIDLFCAQFNTPTVMMGDIFLHCSHCFVLADCEPGSLFDAAAMMEDVLKVIADDDDSHQERIDSYVERLDDVVGSKDVSWHDIFNDLFGNDTVDLCGLANVLSCQWFTRVWTLQEFALPPKLSILSESQFSHASLKRSDLDPLFSKMLRILHGALDVFMRRAFPDYQDDTVALYMLEHRSLDEQQMLHAMTNPGVSRCYYSIKKVHEIQAAALRLDATDTSNSVMHPMVLRHYGEGLDLLPLYLANFTESPRTCTDPSDYIYGVIGLLDIDIPRTSNQRLVWVAFRNELLKRAPYLASIPRHYDFEDASDMQSFYGFLSRDVLDAQLGKLFKTRQFTKPPCHPGE